MTDDRVETHIGIDRDGRRELIHFQEYWIRLRADVPVRDVVIQGVEDATPAPGVVEAITDADDVLLPPSNPVVSIGPIASVPGIRGALAATAAPVVGVSPVIGAGAVHGMADQLLTGLGVEISVDGWLVDTVDTGRVAEIDALGITARAVPLWMSDDTSTDQLARDTLDLAVTLRANR